MGIGFVAQLVRALPCHGRGREFESRRIRHRNEIDPKGLILFLSLDTTRRERSSPAVGAEVNLKLVLDLLRRRPAVSCPLGQE